MIMKKSLTKMYAKYKNAFLYLMGFLFFVLFWFI